MARIIGFAGGAFVNVDQGGDASEDGRISIGVNDVIIIVKTPDETVPLRFDFTDELEDDITLASVTATVPDGLTGSGEATDTDEGTFDIDIAAGTHAGMYVLTFTGTLNNALTVTRNWPIRVFNG